MFRRNNLVLRVGRGITFVRLIYDYVNNATAYSWRHSQSEYTANMGHILTVTELWTFEVKDGLQITNRAIEQVLTYMFVHFITISKQINKNINIYPTPAHNHKQICIRDWHINTHIYIYIYIYIYISSRS